MVTFADRRVQLLACFRVPRVRQFQAVLWKNYLLQTRASKAWYSFGAVGWIALLIQVAIPGIFFALTCIPKHFVQPQHIPQQLSRISDLDGGNWASTYNGTFPHSLPSASHYLGKGNLMAFQQKSMKPINSLHSMESSDQEIPNRKISGLFSFSLQLFERK